jgi:hypothetical protein
MQGARGVYSSGLGVSAAGRGEAVAAGTPAVAVGVAVPGCCGAGSACRVASEYVGGGRGAAGVDEAEAAEQEHDGGGDERCDGGDAGDAGDCAYGAEGVGVQSRPRRVSPLNTVLT